MQVYEEFCCIKKGLIYLDSMDKVSNFAPAFESECGLGDMMEMRPSLGGSCFEEVVAQVVAQRASKFFHKTFGRVEKSL